MGVSFEAYSAFRGPSLDTVGIWSRIIITENTPPTLQWSMCGSTAQFELVSGDARQHHKWDSHRMEEADARKRGLEFVCIGSLGEGPITPEMKRNQLSFSIATKDVLGDSLPGGRYKITLRLPIVG